MSDDTQVLRTYFLKLGLEAEVADLYLALHAYGPQSISELSRHSKVERTRIYRLIDVLTETNLIEVEAHYKRSIIKAAPVSNLQILLSKKEEDLRSLRAELARIQQALHDSSQAFTPTKVQFYKGAEGLKQMFWNETRCNTENLSILYESMQNRTKSSFFERWVRTCNERGIYFRSIVGDHFLQTQEQWYSTKDNERLEHWEAKQVPASIFSITHSTIVYDDVVGYYNWHEGNLFGIEVYNQEIADAQRAFFEMLWQQSNPISKKLSQQLKDDTLLS